MNRYAFIDTEIKEGQVWRLKKHLVEHIFGGPGSHPQIKILYFTALKGHAAHGLKEKRGWKVETKTLIGNPYEVFCSSEDILRLYEPL